MERQTCSSSTGVAVHSQRTSYGKKFCIRYLMQLGIPRGGFHSMRHGATSALLADGATPAVVQKQLRHSDPRITLGVYGHVIGNQQRDAVENRSARIEQFAVN